jgi:hypothetical protein
MVDSVQIVQLLVAIAAIVIALYGYMFNAKAQRKLDRNKIQYETKLKAFNDFIQASRGAMNAYDLFRGLNARFSQSDNDVEAGLIFASFAQDLEKPLGTSVCVGIAGRLEELDDRLRAEGGTGKELKDPKDADTVAGAVSSLEILFRRVYTYHHERMAIAFENAVLVMDKNLGFRRSAKAFVEYLEQAFAAQGKMLNDFFKGLKPGGIYVTDGEYEPDEMVSMLWIEVQAAMNEELAKTL